MATFYNQATLSYNDTVTNSNIVTGEIVDTITADKTSVTDTYTSGDTVTYIVTVRNTGATALTGVTITDDLGAYPFGGEALTPLDYIEGTATVFVNGVAQPVPDVTAGPPLVISGFSIPAGGSAVVIYQARTNEFAPPDIEASITNTASITAAGVTEPVTASHTINADVRAALTITKSLSPEVVTENGMITYTFTISNTGNVPITSADNAVVTDNFSPVLSDIAVTFNGAVWTEPDEYAYNELTGVFRTNTGEITVPAATYTQDPATGAWIIQPGVSVLRVTGNI